MINVIILCSLLAAVHCGDVARPWETLNRAKTVTSPSWEQFKVKYEKQYKGEEETLRQKIYETNLKKIELHNHLYERGLRSFTLGENKYSDMDFHEFSYYMNGYKMRPAEETATHDRMTYMSPLAELSLPDEVDWRKQGYVTDVKDQGKCGSCWAFSTTGTLEGQLFRKTSKLVSLSEQNLVDCSGSYGNNGCNGGLVSAALQYIADNGGIDSEDCYPYTAKDGTCHFETSCVAGTCAGHTDVPKGDEDALKEVVASVGPVSVAIDANHDSFMQYKSGIYDNPDCGSTEYDLDHAVLVVGYGTEDGQDYWLVKNSWGTSWGEDGYVKMARNKDNQCGIATEALYPNV